MTYFNKLFSSDLKGYTAQLIIAAILVSVLLANFNSSAYVWKAAFIGVKDPQLILKNYADIDKLYRPESANGNFLLKFEGFDSTNLNHVNFAARTYYRANYLLFPKRVYVHDSKTSINFGGDIIDAKFSPNIKWLLKYNIKHIVGYRHYPSSQIIHTVFDLKNN